MTFCVPSPGVASLKPATSFCFSFTAECGDKEALSVNMEKERHLVETPAKYSGDGLWCFLPWSCPLPYTDCPHKRRLCQNLSFSHWTQYTWKQRQSRKMRPEIRRMKKSRGDSSIHRKCHCILMIKPLLVLGFLMWRLCIFVFSVYLSCNHN